MSFLTILSLLHVLTFGHVTASADKCGDGALYAWQPQTGSDLRFAAFPKLTGKRNGPRYPGGDKAFDRFVRERLILDDEAKHYSFVLNYYFTVRCDGTIDDVEVLGDPEVKDWTNIASVVGHTTGWKAAEKDGKTVDCIYFRTLPIDGRKSR